MILDIMLYIIKDLITGYDKVFQNPCTIHNEYSIKENAEYVK